MNIMKKKPELLKKTGKSSQTLRKFLNNLKENDLHYENKQITQCVFLGVLRLKPVPSIFSNNVPSVSTTVEINKSKRIKNIKSNKELNKNASKKNNINKVLSGKISKKSTDKVKAAVKKVPIKKSSIKIKLNPKKKIDEVEPSMSNGNQETPSSDTSNTESPDSIIARSTLTISPIVSPTKFNPVQNLFDKLKQRREESQNEAGPSKIAALSNKTKEVSKSSAIRYKVCKINANGHSSPNINSCKKLKKSLYKKSHERLSLPLISTSPITVSDTESIGKKDKDDVILLDENNSSNGDSSDNGIVEDIIIINDDPRPKNEEVINQEIIDKRVQIRNSTSTLLNINAEQFVGTSQCEEVIVIADEPKQIDKLENNNVMPLQESEENHHIIVIDEVREVRVSPRLKKIEEKTKETTANIESAFADEVVVITDDKNVSNTEPEILQKDSVDIFKTQELNIAVDSRQNENKKQKMSPKLSKVVDADNKLPAAIKKELIEEAVIVNEKPKRRKNTMRSPTLLPPMLLNAPMLLRSELAPKKPNYVNEKPRVRKSRSKIKDSSNSKPVMGPVKNTSRVESTKLLNKNAKTLQLEKEISRSDQGYLSLSKVPSTMSVSCECDDKQSDEIICIDDSSKNKSSNGRAMLKKLNVTQHNTNNNEVERVQVSSHPQELGQKESPKSSCSKLQEYESVKNDIIILNDEENDELKTKPKEIKKQRIKIFNKKSVSEITAHKDEDVVIVKEENNPKEKISPRLLRSDLLKQKTLLEATNIHSPNTEKVESEVNEFINLTEEPESNKYISPRTLRSNFIKKDPTSRNSLMDNIIVIKDEEFSTKSDEMLQKLSEADKSQQKNKRKSIQKTKQIDLDEIIIVNDRTVKKQEKYSGRLLRSDLSQLSAKKGIPIKTELEEVVLIHDEPKQKEKSAFLPLKPSSNELSCGSENVVPEEQKSEIKGKTLRSSRLDRVRKYNTEVTSPKPKSKNSGIVKVENNSLRNSSGDQQLNVDNLHENSPRDFEQPSMEVIVVKVEKETSSHRLLRSETARRRLSENINVSNANIDNMISASRLLRSEICTQKNSQNVTKEQSSSPKTTRKKRSPQNSPQSSKRNTSSQNEPSKVVVIQNELIENQRFAPEDAEMQKQSESSVSENSPTLLGKKPEMASDIQDTEMQKQSDLSITKKSPKRLSKQSKILARSKKVVVSKKKKRFHNRKLVPKTPMLLRSELAHLKNVVSDIQSNEKKITKKKAKSKLDNVPNNNQLLDNSNFSFELQSNGKNEKKLKTRLSQTRSSNKNVSKPERHVEIIDSKKSAKIDAISEENVGEILETQTICENEIVPAEVPMLLQHENSNNSPTRKNKITKILNKDTVQSSTEVDVVTTESPKRKSPSTRKKNKRKRITKPEQEQTTSNEILDSQPVQFQDVQEENEICDITSKKADITVFDFDESEPEVVPLRSNNTPKKEKSISFTSKDSTRSNPPEENVTPKSKKEKPTVRQGAIPSEVNVTPKSKKQKIADEPIAKAQAKVQLLAVFDENPTQTKDLDTPANPDKNKTKSTSKKKIVKNQLVQEPCPQNVNVKRRSKSKTSPNKTNTPQTKQSQDTSGNTVRTSTSPLKQTTITDMFNVMMKKEKSSADSIFEASPKEPTAKPREENSSENVKTNMPPPKLDKKPPSNNDVEEYYEDDSDCDSRMEWIPEEYAEYKFKYSAKKMMTYKPIHKCKICLLILPTYYKLSKHKEEHAKKQNPYNCKQCERSFSNVEDLTAHLRVHKGKHPYTCKKCDVGFWSKKALDAHTPIHVLRKVKQPNKRFRCDVCAKEFSKLCDMERHTRVHTGEKPCICNICNKRFQQSHNLSKHLLTHLHVKPFHCEICNKQFGRNDVLNRHLLTHSVDKPIKCPLCSKGFIRQSQLNNHMKKNHLDAAKIGVTAEFKVAEAK